MGGSSAYTDLLGFDGVYYRKKLPGKSSNHPLDRVDTCLSSLYPPPGRNVLLSTVDCFVRGPKAAPGALPAPDSVLSSPRLPPKNLF